MKLPLTSSKDYKLAVIADIHLHDVNSHYDFPAKKLNPLKLTLRSWADTRRSSRVFNESKSALHESLLKAAQQGIKHVVILGDYTDDGQLESVDRIAALLKDYRARYGFRFYVLPGNHDYHGPFGKHQSTRFATTPGQSVLVTSKEKIAATEADSSILTEKMFCGGIPDNIMPMAGHGLFKQSDFLHWETPFGTDDSVRSRLFTIRSDDHRNEYQMMDATYLVEPEEGLWLLMVDANVNEPRVGDWKATQKAAFMSSTNAGWNAVIKHKPYLLNWINDVYQRANILNKTIFFFSHYPVLDPYRDNLQYEKRLFGETDDYRRTPSRNVGDALIKNGVNLHFGGHLHVNANTSLATEAGKLIDIAVPSLVAFPPCFKVIRASKTGCELATIRLNQQPVDQTLIEFYKAEQQILAEQHDLALKQSLYDHFHYHRIRCRVLHHYLPKYWPQFVLPHILESSLLALIGKLLDQSNEGSPLYDNVKLYAQTIASDTVAIESFIRSHTDFYSALLNAEISLADLEQMPVIELIADWYALRQGGSQALEFIGNKKLSLYRVLTQEFAASHKQDINTIKQFFPIFFQVLLISLSRACETKSDK